VPKKLTAREIAETAEILRAHKQANVLQVEYRRNGRIRWLTKIRFGRAESARPTRRTIDCLDDGAERSYDKGYDFEVTAFVGANGNRIEL
jgi:hypothetical protein